MGQRHSRDKESKPLIAPCGGTGASAPCGGTNVSESEPKRAAPKPQPALTIPRANPGWKLPEHYQVLKSIGKGSYGSVCECRDARNGELYAAKQLKGLFEDLVDCKRILRELAILTRLDSDSVVRVHDVVIPGDTASFNELYIILEICDSDLKKLVKSDVRLNGEHINTLLYNLLVGLRYIHSAGVYHRDLKPANILVNANCDVKICDFGLARAMGGEGITDDHLEDEDGDHESSAPVVAATMRRKRAMTSHVVTRWYRAPELILMQRGYTEAIDVWSVGCIYAELLEMQDEDLRLQDRSPIFPGSSCFPLSPERRGGKRIKQRGSNDQLESIFDVIGTPSEAELDALDNKDARRYVENFPTRTAMNLAGKYRTAGTQEIDLLTKMLLFSPKARLTVQQALEHQALAAVRGTGSAEKVAPGYVVLNFEKECNDRGEMTEAQLRRNFQEERDKFLRGT